jgi:hypothetical protein
VEKWTSVSPCFKAIHFTAYESAKVFLRDALNEGKEMEEEGFAVQFIAGGAAGGLAVWPGRYNLLRHNTPF